MSKREKLIKKLRNNPHDVKFETIQKLLLSFGFKERQPKGWSSHYTYTFKTIIITIPKHKPVNSIYVKKVMKIIDSLHTNNG